MRADDRGVKAYCFIKERLCRRRLERRRIIRCDIAYGRWQVFVRMKPIRLSYGNRISVARGCDHRLRERVDRAHHEAPRVRTPRSKYVQSETAHR